MTLAQLRAFLAAYETGSFTAAGVELDSSQASVSELIGRLEREIGLQLFARGGRRLVPTAAAEELREHALRAVAAIDGGLDALTAMTSLDGGVCTFGVLRNAAYYELSDLVQRFHHRYPNVRVRLVGLNSALVAESIASGEIEAGIVVLPVAEEGLAIRPLFRDEVFFASAERDPADGPVGIVEFAARKLVLYDAYAGWRDPTRMQLLDRARLQGLTIDAEMEVEHVETALSLAATGAADTIVSGTVARGAGFPEGLRLTPFEQPLYDTVALVHREGSFLSPATARIAELAEHTLLAAADQDQVIAQPPQSLRAQTTVA